MLFPYTSEWGVLLIRIGQDSLDQVCPNFYSLGATNSVKYSLRVTMTMGKQF